MHIIITPRLTLRPPLDIDADDLAELTSAPESVLAGARHVIVRERVIGWVDAAGAITLGARWKALGLEREIAAALLRDVMTPPPIIPQMQAARPSGRLSAMAG